MVRTSFRQPPRRRRSAAHRVSAALYGALRRGVSWRGRPEPSPASASTFSRKGRRGRPVADLPLDTYAGLFIADGTVQVVTRRHTTQRAAESFPLPDRSGLRTMPPIQQVCCRRRGRRSRRSSPRSAARSTATSVPNPISAAPCRRRSLDAVFAEVEQNQRPRLRQPVDRDDDFTLSPSYLEGFCRRIAGLRMSWSCLSRANG